ncbi:MAG: helix-turn-helix transcriptional regulator [Myxococcota bacterium]
MTFGSQIAARLKRIRRDQRAPQEVVSTAVGASVSAVSRLERGMRKLRVDQLVAWAGALGYRVDVVFWTPASPAEKWDPEHMDRAMGLDDECAEVLAEVASALGHMPPVARRVLAEKVALWRTASTGPAPAAESPAAE